jgi:hypothetical protein
MCGASKAREIWLSKSHLLWSDDNRDARLHVYTRKLQGLVPEVGKFDLFMFVLLDGKGF